MAVSDFTATAIVAVYGSLKKGFGNHSYLTGAKYLANGKVKGFDMFSLTYFPMIVPGKGEVTVELYEVDRETFARLDSLEGFPSFYGRKIVEVEAVGVFVESWIYYGNSNQVKDCKRVESGDWQGDNYHPTSVRMGK